MKFRLFWVLWVFVWAGCSPPHVLRSSPSTPAPAPALATNPLSPPQHPRQPELFFRALDALRAGQTTQLELLARPDTEEPWRSRARQLLDLQHQLSEETSRQTSLQKKLQACLVNTSDLEKANETLLHDLEELKKILVETTAVS